MMPGIVVRRETGELREKVVDDGSSERRGKENTKGTLQVTLITCRDSTRQCVSVAFFRLVNRITPLCVVQTCSQYFFLVSLASVVIYIYLLGDMRNFLGYRTRTGT